MYNTLRVTETGHSRIRIGVWAFLYIENILVKLHKNDHCKVCLLLQTEFLPMGLSVPARAQYT